MFLALFVKICLFDLEIDFLTLKITLSHENNTRNGLPSQNHMKMRYYTCSWLHLLKKTYLTLKYLAAILFLPLKNSAQGCQSGTLGRNFLRAKTKWPPDISRSNMIFQQKQNGRQIFQGQI